MKKITRNYFVFWFGQAVSQLGSSMTSFALTIWIYKQTGLAMSLSLLSFCTYLPYVMVSIFAGGFVDRHSKKAILIIADTIAAIGTASIFLGFQFNMLSTWQIYCVNIITGFMNAFQSPAASIVTGLLVPDGQYEKASGLNSFSSNLITVAAPVFAGMLMAFGGLKVVVLIDLLTFLFGVGTVLSVSIKEPSRQKKKVSKKTFEGLTEGVSFLRENKGLLYIILNMAFINFFSRLTYENILSPMILSRSGGNSTVFGIVSGVLGIGGIIGGILVTVGKKKGNPLKMIFFSAAISFLLGDLLMGVGRNLMVWCIAGLAASIPIPFIMAGQNLILYRLVPIHMQGRVFSLRNAVQYSTIPVGILLGGYLADYVFEPFMASTCELSLILKKIVGTGAGSGMAVMFLCTGILGSILSCVAYRNKYVQSIKSHIS